jgi:hypothetical protein
MVEIACRRRVRNDFSRKIEIKLADASNGVSNEIVGEILAAARGAGPPKPLRPGEERRGIGPLAGVRTRQGEEDYGCVVITVVLDGGGGGGAAG